MKKAVIIGAGQTGRGFIAPIVRENGYAITFLDKDRALVDQLRNRQLPQLLEAQNRCQVPLPSAFSHHLRRG